MNPARMFVIVGAISAFLAVALGAFGAHALKQRLTPEALEAFQTAVRYQMYHALGLVATAWVVSQWPQSNAGVAGWLFASGSLFFCGSLYALSLAEIRWLGAVTPVGGLMFLAGWLWLAWSVWRGS